MTAVTIRRQRRDGTGKQERVPRQGFEGTLRSQEREENTTSRNFSVGKTVCVYIDLSDRKIGGEPSSDKNTEHEDVQHKRIVTSGHGKTLTNGLPDLLHLHLSSSHCDIEIEDTSIVNGRFDNSPRIFVSPTHARVDDPFEVFVAISSDEETRTSRKRRRDTAGTELQKAETAGEENNGSGHESVTRRDKKIRKEENGTERPQGDRTRRHARRSREREARRRGMETQRQTKQASIEGPDFVRTPVSMSVEDVLEKSRELSKEFLPCDNFQAQYPDRAWDLDSECASVTASMITSMSACAHAHTDVPFLCVFK